MEPRAGWRDGEEYSAMLRRTTLAIGLGSVTLLGALASGCGGGNSGGGAPPPTGATNGTGSGANSSGTTASGSGGTSGGAPATSNGGTAGTGTSAGSGGASGSASGTGGSSGKPADIMPPTMDVLQKLDSSVDWSALTIIYPTMYSAFDGVHTFQVPAHVDGATVDIGNWQAIPDGSVNFDPDPDVQGGVMITVLKQVDKITIAAHSGKIGGTAPLYITAATPAEWQTGNARYNNGVDFTLMIDFSKILDPTWTPPPPPPNLACINCHTTGAKYFEIQHTPTQCARFSDDDLTTIFTKGMKPPGVGFTLLPAMIGNTSATDLYAQFHKWMATPEEVKGLVVYLRSLTPKGQGSIRLPDGTYVPVGTGGSGSGTGGSSGH